MIVNINGLLQDRDRHNHGDLVRDHLIIGDLDRDLRNHGVRGLNGLSKKLMIEVVILLSAPKIPEVLDDPEVLEDPEVPGGPEAPGDPEAPEGPEAPEALEALEVPEGPKAPESTIQVEIHITLKESHVLGKCLYLVS